MEYKHKLLGQENGPARSWNFSLSAVVFAQIILIMLPPSCRAAHLNSQQPLTCCHTWGFGAVASVSGPAAMAAGALAAMAVPPRRWAEDEQQNTSVSMS